ncbi:MAG: molybdenum cofactor guanylyltransferase [Candidatus Bathyarchaeia archaeon]
MIKRCAIVLAGGKAERFQVNGSPWIDKALANVLGKPLLIHVIERLKSVVEEIIICVNNEARKCKYTKVLRDFSIKCDNLKIVKDLKIPFIRGPAVAIVTGLRSTDADYCIVVPCDTPFIQPAVVDYLFSAVKDASVAIPIHADGSVETLMFTCEREKTAEVSETLCWLGRDRPDDFLRGLPKVKFISTIGELRDLDPEFKSFININFQRDLIELRTRVTANGPIRSIQVNLGAPENSDLGFLRENARKYLEKRFIDAVNVFSTISDRFEKEKLYFWAGLCREKEGNIIQDYLNMEKNAQLRGKLQEESRQAFIKAAQNYALEAEFFAQKQIHLLARRAKEDETWCKRRVQQTTRDY